MRHVSNNTRSIQLYTRINKYFENLIYICRYYFYDMYSSGHKGHKPLHQGVDPTTLVASCEAHKSVILQKAFWGVQECTTPTISPGGTRMF